MQNRMFEAYKREVMTGDPTPFMEENWGAKGLELIVNVEAIDSGQTVTVNIDSVDAWGNPVNILASAAYATTGIRRLVIYPGLTASTNLVANSIIGRKTRIKPVLGDQAKSCTLSISGSLIE